MAIALGGFSVSLFDFSMWAGNGMLVHVPLTSFRRLQ